MTEAVDLARKKGRRQKECAVASRWQAGVSGVDICRSQHISVETLARIVRQQLGIEISEKAKERMRKRLGPPTNGYRSEDYMSDEEWQSLLDEVRMRKNANGNGHYEFDGRASGRSEPFAVMNWVKDEGNLVVTARRASPSRRLTGLRNGGTERNHRATYLE